MLSMTPVKTSIWEVHLSVNHKQLGLHLIKSIKEGILVRILVMAAYLRRITHIVRYSSNSILTFQQRPFPANVGILSAHFTQILARSAESSLVLEVIAGPCHGICCSRQSTSPVLPIILGRVPPSDLVLKDSEVSGKHARISWNVKVYCSEILDFMYF